MKMCVLSNIIIVLIIIICMWFLSVTFFMFFKLVLVFVCLIEHCQSDFGSQKALPTVKAVLQVMVKKP